MLLHGGPGVPASELAAEREIETVTAASLAYGVYDLSMTPSARRWGDQRIVVNRRAAGSPSGLAIHPGAPHEFLNLRDAIPGASAARERMAGFVDRVLA